MTDEADLGNDRAAEQLADALARRRQAGPVACGACHYCGEDLKPGQRWCDRACEADWEYEQERRAANAD
jgi:hypothetical protein